MAQTRSQMEAALAGAVAKVLDKYTNATSPVVDNEDPDEEDFMPVKPKRYASRSF